MNEILGFYVSRASVPALFLEKVYTKLLYPLILQICFNMFAKAMNFLSKKKFGNILRVNIFYTMSMKMRTRNGAGNALTVLMI